MIPWPDGYHASPLAQIICAFVIGLVLSWLSSSLVLIVVTIIILEAFFCACNYHRYSVFFRTAVLFSSVAGWIVGRSIHRMETYIISKRHDEKHGIRYIRRRDTGFRAK